MNLSMKKFCQFIFASLLCFTGVIVMYSTHKNFCFSVEVICLHNLMLVSFKLLLKILNICVYFASVMTTAHRPTFVPARGGTGKNEGDLSKLSQQYSSKDMPSHTKLKYRQKGQSHADEVRSKVSFLACHFFAPSESG